MRTGVETLEAALSAIVGEAHVLTDADTRAAYERDWTGAWIGQARMVVRPGSTAEVAAVLDACRGAGAPLVPQGGNTGLVGGSVPDGSGRAVVLSTSRLRRLGPVDADAAQVSVGAGVTLAVLAEHAAAAGFDVPVDLAARQSATIGGMVATNAGGLRVLRHGMMRQHVAGVEAVLGTGAVVSHLAGLAKDNTGYDLAGLLCGSEGTLGVVTEVRLRLVASLPERVTAVVAFTGLAAARDGVRTLRRAVPGLDAAEYVVAPGARLVRSTLGVAGVFARLHPVEVVVEVAGEVDPTDELAAVVNGLPGVLEVAVATPADGSGRRAALWEIRERHTEALARVGPPRKYDVSVPLATLPVFVDEVVARVAGWPESDGAVCHHFGHLGDGNVHLNVLGLEGIADHALERLDGLILGLVAAHGGSISAEHGIGRLKRRWLHLSRQPDELAAFAAVKQALDPDGLLNPGVLLPDRP